jgi:hypothetical protein
MPEQVDGSGTAELVPLSVLALDLPVPVNGWAASLHRQGFSLLEDDLGRPSVPRAVARSLFAQHREQQEAAARHRAEIERRVIEADRRFRASLPGGVAQDQVPVGVSPGLAMMLADPERQGSKRESMVEHALRHPAGALVYHPIREES